MKEAPLQARFDRRDGAPPRVLAPTVGWWFDPPPPGTVVGPGSAIGRMRCLNRVYLLVMPADASAGRVEREAGARSAAVGYGQALFRLRPLASDGGAGGAGDPARDGGAAGAMEGSGVVRAPTDGVFYRRPSPDAPPFVEVGSRVRSGQPVGLVEVMKTFNQILYGGPGLPEEGEVVEIRCEDGDEVSAGQPLLIVR